MRKFIPILALLLLTTTIYCEKKTDTESGFLLSYKYVFGKPYNYKKVMNSDDEKFVSFIQIQALDSTRKGEINFKYKLDSCAYYYKNSLRRQKASQKLEYAQIQITYTKTGKLLKRIYFDDTRKDYSINSDYSDNEILFELPAQNIEFGKTWKTSRTYDNGLHSIKTKKLENKLVGLENKNGHSCYRVDFQGTDIDVSRQDDYTQTDEGKIVGTFWIDKESMIIIAVESETVFGETKAQHPGLSPFAGLKLISRAPIKMTLEIIE